MLIVLLIGHMPALARPNDLEKAEQSNAKVQELYGAGQYAEAIPFAKKTLAIREKVLGPAHPDTAGSLNNLALLYKATGAYDQAKPLYQRALAIHEKVLGPAHPETVPGESVWRATLNEQHEHINGMGKGTTFATGHVAGAAALWLSVHRNDPALRTLSEQGLLTETFRAAIQASAWRPSKNSNANPPGTHCDNASWDSDYGTGILNLAALLDVPLSGAQSKAIPAGEEETIPLFASLYPRGTEPERIRADYRSLFPSSKSGKVQDLNSLETEILYHYTVNEEVQREINNLVAGQRGDEPVDAVRRALVRQDLSGRLRQALSQ